MSELIAEFDVQEYALEWAACRRAIRTIKDLTDEELDALAHHAVAFLLGGDDEE